METLSELRRYSSHKLGRSLAAANICSSGQINYGHLAGACQCHSHRVGKRTRTQTSPLQTYSHSTYWAWAQIMDKPACMNMVDRNLFTVFWKRSTYYTLKRFLSLSWMQSDILIIYWFPHSPYTRLVLAPVISSTQVFHRKHKLPVAFANYFELN